MFRFWSSDPRGGDKTVEAAQPMSDVLTKHLSDASIAAITTSLQPRKRNASDSDDDESPLDATPQCFPPLKRARIDHSVATPPETPGVASVAREEYFMQRAADVQPDIEEAKDVIQYQFGLEILLKHDELRLINQELAKCQVALEQLRRCHLIPYPTSCPTPEQMLNISSGKGPALQMQPGAAVPKWAPPFGVVDGPYARHYAKWLIPDPAFDGILPDWQGVPDVSKFRNAVEGRTTRNSLSDMGGAGKRPMRGLSGQKLQALSSGYPQPKEKAGPCVLKRADGQTVKLVCIDCQRENFSSTQGFINHCRIAHRRDFKSHEEAAVHCGHPIAVDEGGAVVGEEKSSGSSASGLVHPFARIDALDDHQTLTALRSRIAASLKMYKEGKLPGVHRIPGAALPSSSKVDKKPSKSFVGASDAPYLSKLMQSRSFSGNLKEHVADAKVKEDLNEIFSPEEESDDSEQPSLSGPVPPKSSVAARHPAPAVMRVPARTVTPPSVSDIRPTSSKGLSPQVVFASKAPVAPSPEGVKDDDESRDYDMDVDLSPNTIASNNAPSLVSDDGEYDDSDDGSSSETGDSVDAESVSDVAEITIDEDQDHDTPRAIRHHRGSTNTPVKMKKDESKHVTFVSPMRGPTKGKKKQKI